MSNLEGGAYISSGKFKCLFDHEDYIDYLQNKDEKRISCLDGFVAVIAEKKEFDKEEAFARKIKSALPAEAQCYINATLLFATSDTRYTLSPRGLVKFQQLADVSRNLNCMNLFKSPKQLQAICMKRGTPLSGKTILSTIASSQHPLNVPTQFIGTCLTELVLGLKLMLDAHMFHGDIKLNNILFFPNPSTHKTTFRIIDFGKSQTKSEFLERGYWALARPGLKIASQLQSSDSSTSLESGTTLSSELRLWYNPLCLGIVLHHIHHIQQLQSKHSISDFNMSDEEKHLKASKFSLSKPLLEQLFPQIDKYAFMFVVWQFAHAVTNKDTRKTLIKLILTCRVQKVPPEFEKALSIIQSGPDIKDHPFRKFMIKNGIVWFQSWYQIYAHVYNALSAHTSTETIAKTMKQLLHRLCPVS